MKIFLAGPFFNEECRSTLSDLLIFLEDKLHHTVFCAMRDGCLVPKDATEETRQKYFLLDVSKMHWADCVIALLDYPLPINQGLYFSSRSCEGATLYKSILLPDTGTVFEMGLAYALKKPIVGFAENIQSLNLMLAQSCKIIVPDCDTLEQVLCCLKDSGLKNTPSGKELFQL